jgi:hypothetical protein
MRQVASLLAVAAVALAVFQPTLAQDDATPVPRTQDRGSRTEPIPFGTAADIGGGWWIHVVDVIPNANVVVGNENMFNDPPAPGRQFFVVTMSVTYEGPAESGSMAFSSPFSLVGDAAIAYNQSENSCGVVPNDFPSTDIFRGGTIEFNECWEVPSDDEEIASLVMFAENPEDLFGDDRTWFSIDPESGAESSNQ